MEQDKGQASRPSDTARLLFLGREEEQGHGLTQQPLLSLRQPPSVTPWTVTRQAPLSVGFSRQEYWTGVPSPSPGGLPNLGIEPASLASPSLAGRFFTTSTTWVGPSFCKPEKVATRNLPRRWRPHLPQDVPGACQRPPLKLRPRVQPEHGPEASKPSSALGAYPKGRRCLCQRRP